MKITSLQTMRLFASLGVVQYHLWHNYLGVSIGHPGTDFFLVLVGVVAALAQAKRIPNGDWRGYTQARYIRLYITYIPLFIIVLVAKWDEATWDWALKSFFFIPMADRLPVICATWMLSMFMLFYFIFSLAFLVKSETILWFVFLFWAVGIVFYTWLGWTPGLPVHWSRLFFDERNLDFIFGYFVGVILRERYLSIHWGRRIFWFGIVGVITGTILLNLGINTIGRSLFIGLPVALFILGLANLEQHKASDFPIKILTSPWLVWLGGTSYVLYLSHGIYLQVWSRILPIAPILVPVISLGAIIAGVIGYILWEEPLLNSIKKKAWIPPQIPYSTKIIELRDKIGYKIA